MEKQQKLSSIKQVHYFTTNQEYKDLPVNSDFILKNIKALKKSLCLFLTQFLQNFFFFMICKSGNNYLYLTGLMAFLIMTGGLTILAKKSPSAKSKTSLAFIGLLDIIYFLILLGTGHHINSFVFTIQLQATLIIRVFLIKFILSESFYTVQYLGAIIIFVTTLLNLSYFGDRYTYLLLLGIILHCINNIIKRHYLKKFKVDSLAMNKYSLMFAAIFGIILTPFLSLLLNDSIEDSLQGEILCLVGINCFLMPVYLVLLLASTFVHQFMVNQSINEREGQQIVYMFNSVTAFCGFYIAELVLGQQNSNILEVIFLLL